MNSQSHKPKFGTLDQVDAWLETAKRLGYRIRYDHFGGNGGGVCEFGGQKWVFIDVALSAIEQLEMLETELPKDAGFQDSQVDLPVTKAA